ncbi:MAG TPA: divergent PAP2 family protein [Erysipelotrichaceae bacterium]|nr:divergent PAP2 family protein [Erysipelotrichaceae bacterium]
MYPFWAAILANIVAQLLKPIFHYLRTRQWRPHLIIESGGFPSSHTSTVTALTLSVGIVENFNSTIFAVTLMFGMIVAYDAANVRYYAGQNIRITQQLIKDIQTLTQTKLDDPIYLLKIKEVLGHKWTEVLGGILVGLLIGGLLYFLR